MLIIFLICGAVPLICGLAYGLSEHFSWDWFNSKAAPVHNRKAKDDEIAPGIPRPTTTLAHMMVAEMLSNLDVPLEYEKHEDDLMKRRVTSFRKFPTFKRTHRHTYWAGYGTVSDVVDYIPDSGKVNFSGKELAILANGFDEFTKINTERAKIKAEADNSHAALNAIASMTYKRNEPQSSMTTSTTLTSED